MKTRISSAVMVAIMFLLGAGTASAQTGKIDPDKLNLKMEIKQLGVEQLRLYRAAILARHCYQFKDAILRSEFIAYQDKKCGPDLYYQYDRPEFDLGKLSKAERDFFDRLKAREEKLKKGQVRIKDGTPVYDRRAIVNLSQFGHLKKPALDFLVKNGFVVTPGKHEQLFFVYEQNDYYTIPGFITVDSVLQLYHLYFGFTLRELEEKKLLPAARSLVQGMQEKMRARHDQATDPELKAAARLGLLYFAVAVDLAGEPQETPLPEDFWSEDFTPGPAKLDSAAEIAKPAPEWMDDDMKKTFIRQRELIYNAKEQKYKGPIMGTMDYNMFTPRGHYTRNLELTRYFLTMIWLGFPGFILDEEEMPIAAALIVVHELTRDPALMKQYNLIYEPTNFYVGPTDDITPLLVREVADELCGKEAPLEKWLAKKEEIRAEVLKRDPTRIKMKFDDDRAKPQVRFMGMRYIPDSEMLSRLSVPYLRPYPTGLDIFGVMKVPVALEILRSLPLKWDGYWPEIKKLQAEFKDLKPQSGELNLYWRWLRILKTLNQPASQGAPPFMAGKPWQFKNLSTALASWAELRHDTILYAKPSGAECGADDPIPARLAQFVEARPEVFGELRELQEFTLSELAKRGLVTEQIEETGGRIAELFTFLERMSRKESEGQPLSDVEMEQLRYFGATLEHLTIAVLADPYARWQEVAGSDRFIAVIADVHMSDQYLEVAVGFADELYALVEMDGYLYLTRGAVLSYYEFIAPERLDDERWQQMLREEKAPPRPDWVKNFLVQQPSKAPTQRASYSSGCR